MNLLERAAQVDEVADLARRLDHGGHLVLISGEAGAGKSALVQELLDHHLRAERVLVGRCDDLFAPRPFGPLADIARGRPGPLAEAMATGDRAAVFDAFLAELAAPPQPTVVVLEDLQWADEATLDLLRFVTRRLEGIQVLVLATYRDDLAPDHSMRQAIGTLIGPRVTRIQVPPLSVDAVRLLVGDRLIDAQTLHASTGGNPFFLVETLNAAPGALPASVRDAVLARALPLSGAARDALDAAAVLGRQVGPDLLQVVADCDSAAVDECLRAGILVDVDGHQAFRHDLSRQAVEETLTPLRRRQLHARALAALGEDGDIVHRAHHAVGARDERAIVDLAGRAADRCVALGAWRQAADLYGQAVAHPAGIPDDERLRLLRARASTCFRVELVHEAVVAGDAALALIAASGDDAALGEWESWLSWAYRAAGRNAEAWDMAERAVARLEGFGPSPALARALSKLSRVLLVSSQFDSCARTSRRATEMAEAFDLEEVAISALDTHGKALAGQGQIEAGAAALLEALDRAKRAGLPDEVARASTNLASLHVSDCRPALALPLLDDATAIAEEHELRYLLSYVRPVRAEALKMLGDLAGATRELSAVLDDPGVSDFNRAMALEQLGQVHARQGKPDAMEVLDEALDLALLFDEAQITVPCRTSLAEAAWLTGDRERAAAEVEAALPFVPRTEADNRRHLTLLAQRTGVAWEPEGSTDEPTLLIIARDWAGLTRFWEERGCPYEAADALAESDDVDDVRRAYERLTFLGARTRAHQAAHRLRELGAREVPRGPRASTRANAAGLTARELEVAGLLADGLTNAAIAERLVVSRKTVDHHASAVLTKLGVSTRRQVASAAAGLGIDLADAAP